MKEKRKPAIKTPYIFPDIHITYKCTEKGLEGEHTHQTHQSLSRRKLGFGVEGSMGT